SRPDGLGDARIPLAMSHPGAEQGRWIAVATAVHQLEVYVGSAADPGAAHFGEHGAPPHPFTGHHEVDRVVRVHGDPSPRVNEDDHVPVPRHLTSGVGHDAW